MTIKKSVIASCVAFAMAGCASNPAIDQDIANQIAQNIDVNFDVVTNHGANEGMNCQSMEAEWASCNVVNLELTNQGDEIDSKDWAIYFHSIRLILDVKNDQFKVTRITGDLHKLEPTDKFDGFQAGEKVTVPLVGEYWTLFKTDFMPRAYVIAGESEPRTIQSLDTENTDSYVADIAGEQWKRVPGDNNILATAQSRFDKNSDVAVLSDSVIESAIVPTPVKTIVGKGEINLDKGIHFTNDAMTTPMLDALKTRANELGVNTSGQYPVELALNPEAFKGEHKVSGAYKLKVTQKGATVTGYDMDGAFYGVQSLLSLVPQNGEKTIPEITVSDAPRFEYRGVMVDVARNFHSKEAMLRTLDQMAAYKLNKLHLHLSDDEGWRLEIPGLPELTDVGAERCHDLSETECLLPQLGSGPDSNNFGSGFFSRNDYMEILKYAKARGIDVIPELDMPAHSRAAVVAMEARFKRLAAEGKMDEANQYRLMDPQDTSNVTTVQFYDKHSFINPCMGSSLNFVDKVVSEVAAMHAEAGMPLETWHFGGDEAKNIKLGAGFQDINSADKVAWKGDIDLSKQDKPFARSPMCQTLIANGTVSDAAHLPSYFAEKVSEVVAKKGIPNFQAWQDGLKHSKDASSFATDKTRVNFWDVLYWGGVSSAYDWAAKGYDMIISNPDYVYMDMPYEVDPAERGYYWATRATDTRKMFGFAPENLPQNAETSVDRDGNGFAGAGTAEYKGFHGLSAQLWSETVRTDDQYEYMVFPRVLAAAERAWHKAEWENDYKPGVEYRLDTNLVNKQSLNTDWTRFANVLGHRELAKLDAAGIQYRVPVPGAKVVDGKLEMNISFPGLALQYSLDDGKTWMTYNAADKPSVNGKVTVRALSADGKRAGRAVSL